MRTIVLGALFLCATGCASVALRPTTRQPQVTDQAEAPLKRAQSVELSPSGFAGARSMSLQLFPDTRVEVVRDDLRTTKYGTVWAGRIPGDPASSVTFVIRETVVVGNIFTGNGRIFELRYGGNGVHTIREIDQSKFTPDADGEPLPPRKPRIDPQADACASTDPATDIDVMVVYTDDARAAAGGTEAMEAEIVLYVENANQVYINSDVTPQRLRIVHLSEVDYAESKSSTTDLDRLSDPADTFVDGVHALRDQHGADLVSMIVQELVSPGNCGRAHIMETVSTAFENSGFSVVRRFCATSQFSFVHELGHNMSARHEWDADDTNNLPFAFNHAHNNTSPTAPATPWRTLMHRGSGTRIAWFSNPDLNYPIGGDPLGVADGDEPTDNHRALNETALTIANLRCSSPGAANVWMKDTWNDTGAEPNPNTAAEPMWKSPYIWVRNAEDASLTQQHVHENPIPNQENLVYVKLQNGGETTSGELKVYVAKASSGLSWPDSWTQIGAVPIASLTGHAARIVKVPGWTPTEEGHFCLLARWESASDPMAVAEGTNITANTQNNNNVVWRNVNVVDAGGDEADPNRFAMRNPVREAAQYSLVVRIPPEQRYSFIKQGTVSIRLSDALQTAWKRGGGKSRGIRVEGNDLIVTANGASIDGIVLEGLQEGDVQVTFRRKPSTRGTQYQVDVIQEVSGARYGYGAAAASRRVGGVSYEIDASRH